eukprot:4766168-Pleurochrysis_carterae.AAC.4
MLVGLGCAGRWLPLQVPQHCLARGARAPRGIPYAAPAASPHNCNPLVVSVPTRGMVGGGQNTHEGGRRRRHPVHGERVALAASRRAQHTDL